MLDVEHAVMRGSMTNNRLRWLRPLWFVLGTAGSDQTRTDPTVLETFADHGFRAESQSELLKTVENEHLYVAILNVFYVATTSLLKPLNPNQTFFILFINFMFSKSNNFKCLINKRSNQSF